MSLATTATDSSPASARHSDATSSVLPLPTGPPMPTRRACPGDRGGWSWLWRAPMCDLLLRGEQRGVTLRVLVGGDVEQRPGGGGQLVQRAQGRRRGRQGHVLRSEERRVGKDCRGRGW